MSFSTSTTRVLTALLAVGTALAKPIARPQSASPDLFPGIPTASGLTITSLTYYGDGCPEGTLQGQFCPETSSFNVTISDLKAILQDGQNSDDASCHIEVGVKTENHLQLNLLQGDFYGSCYLECEGMTALAHSSVSFAGSSGGSNIPWLFYGPIDTRAVYEHNLIQVFYSECSAGGDFLMLIDLVLHVTRGPAAADAVGYIDIDQLTGAISQAYVIQPSPCGMLLEAKPPSSVQQQYGGSYGKQVAEETKKTGKHSKTSSSYSSSSSYEEKKKKMEEEEEEEKKKKEEEEARKKQKKEEEEERKKKKKEEEEARKKEEEEEEKKMKKKEEEEEEKKMKKKKKEEEEEEEKKMKKKKKEEEEEEKKKTKSGGGDSHSYHKEEIERKKSGGTCGQKCAYIPCSDEEEMTKVNGFTEYEKQAYYESKESYKLSLDIEYNKETKVGYDESTSEGGSEHNQGGSGDFQSELRRTRLLATGDEKKDDKCKRDGDCAH